MELIVNNDRRVSITRNHLDIIIASLVVSSYNRNLVGMSEEEHHELIEVVEIMSTLLDDRSAEELMTYIKTGERCD
jgi:hypothetical protein